MAEYSRIAKGSYVVQGTGGAGVPQVVNLPFIPDTVQIWNYGVYSGPGDHDIPWGYWDSGMGQNTAVCQLIVTTPTITVNYVPTGGISTFSAGQLLMFGPQVQVVSSTKSISATAPTTFTFTANPFYIGDIVEFEGLYQSPTTGMPQMCGMPFQVLSSGYNATTIEVQWDSNGSNYTDLATSPTGAYARKILYPYLYAPGVAFIAGINQTQGGSTTTITTTAPHNFVAGQLVGFRITPIWGTTQLNSSPNTYIPGSPRYFYVIAVLDQLDFVINVTYSTLTAFAPNVPVTAVPGLEFPQVLAVGDVNSGGWPYTGGSLYPSPQVASGPINVPTINGPAIQGAFFNNTSMGFIVGQGNASGDTLSNLGGDPGETVYWEAILHDYASP